MLNINMFYSRMMHKIFWQKKALELSHKIFTGLKDNYNHLVDGTFKEFEHNITQ